MARRQMQVGIQVGVRKRHVEQQWRRQRGGCERAGQALETLANSRAAPSMASSGGPTCVACVAATAPAARSHIGDPARIDGIHQDLSWKSPEAEVCVSMLSAAFDMLVCGWPLPFLPT